MEKIKTGLAAFGLSGQVFHAPFIELHEGFELSTIVERSKDLSRALYPSAHVARAFDELLETDLELIIVNTPGPTHFEYCKRALEAGKHVVVEKPFVTTSTEAQQLIELAARENRLLTVFQNRRFDGDFLTIRQILDSGQLGRIVEFQSAFQRYRPDVTNARAPWREEPVPGNGITYDLCSHLSDQALALFGKPQGVWATMAAQRDNGKTDDYSLIQLIYPELKVSLRAGMIIREEGPRFAVHGTAGSYVKYGLDPQEILLRTGVKPAHGAWAAEPETEWGILNTDAGRNQYPTVPGNYLGYYESVFQTLRNGKPAPVSHDEMITDIRMLEAAFESHRSGCTVQL